jgi:cysteine desulfurase
VHKFNGPKGVGALIVRQGLAWPAWMVGSQERGRRGGTENLPAIAGFAAAAELLMTGPALHERAAHTARLRDLLEQGLTRALPGTVVYGATQPRLPNTICLRFGMLPAELVLNRLEGLGVMASSGSACASAGSEPSHVLTAMGASRDEALCAVRLSLDCTTTEAELRRVLEALPAELGPLMREAQAVAEPA